MYEYILHIPLQGFTYVYPWFITPCWFSRSVIKRKGATVLKHQVMNVYTRHHTCFIWITSSKEFISQEDG